MEFVQIQRKLVNVLLKIPALEQLPGRTSLLDGLPDAGLVRDQNIARLDLNRMIGGLEKMGRLTRKGGVRPVIVVVENALTYVPDGSEIADELHEVLSQLENYYGGDVQLEPEQPVETKILEALIFGPQRDTRLPFAFIQQAEITARSIARLTVPRIISGIPDGRCMYGTGWIIAPGLLITNHHVIAARDYRPKPWGLAERPAEPGDFEAQAQQIVARFDYYVEHTGGAYLDCRNAKLIAENRQLDYAVIELNQAEKVLGRAPISLVDAQPALTRGARVNIVQYPRGGPLRYSIRNNFFVRPADKSAFIFYQTDTEPGASGAPVCNDEWQVVALHHASRQIPAEQVPQEVIEGRPAVVTVLNEAIQIHDILKDLPSSVRQSIVEAQRIA